VIRLRRRRDREITEPGDQWENANGTTRSVINPESDNARPMGSYNGTLGLMVDGEGQPNTIGYYARDYDHSPIIFSRFATRWGDVQLKNGLANGVGSGRIWGYRGEGWLDVTVPTVPGQTRQYGGQLPGNYVQKGPAPSQWTNHVNTGPGSQPNYPGGPGQIMGSALDNPGSGG
jgi:hypothetical protein